MQKSLTRSKGSFFYVMNGCESRLCLREHFELGFLCRDGKAVMGILC